MSRRKFPASKSAPATANRCGEHTTEELQLFCKQCKLPVCTYCVLNKHKEHDWCKISDAVDSQREKLEENITFVCNSLVPRITGELQKMENDVRGSKEKTKDLHRKIDAQSEKIIAQVLKTCRHLKHEVEADTLTLKRVHRELNMGKTDLLNMVKIHEKVLEVGSDLDLIQANIMLELAMENVQKKEDPVFERSIDFKAGEIKTQIVEKLVGHITAVGRPKSEFVEPVRRREAIEMKTIDVAGYQEDITVICPVGSHIWVHFRGSSDNVKLNSNGSIAQRTNFGFVAHSIMKTKDSGLLCADFAERCIRKVLPSGEIIKLINTSPMKPISVCATYDGNFLVCMEDTLRHVSSKANIHKLFKLSVSGRKMQLYGSRIFDIPRKVIENINTDICVIDRRHDDTSRLCVMHTSGAINFIYDVINPWDIACDRRGRIFVISRRGHDIHLLDKAGTPMQSIHIESGFVTYSIGLEDDNELWVGGEKGKILSVQY